MVFSQSILNMGSQTIACNTIQLPPGVLFQTANNAILTISGAIIANPNQQIFDTITKGGTITLTNKCCNTLYPQWWGAKQDATSNDTASVNSTIVAAMSIGVPIKLLTGSLVVNTATNGIILNILSGICNLQSAATPCGLTMKGSGYQNTRIVTTTCNADLISANSGTSSFPVYDLEDFTIVGPDTSHSSACSGNGIYINGSASAKGILRNIYGLQFFGIGKAVFNIGNTQGGITLDTLRADLSDIGFKLSNVAQLTAATNLATSGIYSHGFDLQNMQNGSLGDLSSQGTGCTGLYAVNISGINIHSLYLENSATQGAGCYGMDLEGGVKSNIINSLSLVDTADVLLVNGASGNAATNNTFYNAEGVNGNQGAISIGTNGVGNAWNNFPSSIFSGGGCCINETFLFVPHGSSSGISFTPIPLFAGSNTGWTYTSSGNYRRIGNLVYVHATVTITGVGSSTGIAEISGIPVLPADKISGQMTAAGLNTVRTGLVANMGAGSSIIFMGIDSGQSGSLSNSDFVIGSTVTVTMVYTVNP